MTLRTVNYTEVGETKCISSTLATRLTVPQRKVNLHGRPLLVDIAVYGRPRTTLRLSVKCVPGVGRILASSSDLITCMEPRIRLAHSSLAMSGEPHARRAHTILE